jgi:hypothetical protein
MVDRLITRLPPPNAPGIYGVISSTGVTAATGFGIVAIVGRASFGPIDEAVSLGSPEAVQARYGDASAPDRSDMTSTLANLAREAWLGGALGFVCARVGGTGGAAASLTGGVESTDVTPVQVGDLVASSEGVFGNNFRVALHDRLANPTQRELVVYHGSRQIQVTTFAKGGDEAAALQLRTASAPYVRFVDTRATPGDVSLASLSQASSELQGGIDPTVSAGDYADAFALLSIWPWATLVTDTENLPGNADEAGMFQAIREYVDNEALWGRFRTAAVGQPTSEYIQDRYEAASAVNSALVRYQGTGFEIANPDGTMRVVEGYLAAAVDAGIMSTLTPGTSMTWRAVPRATGLIVGVPGYDEESAIGAGMGYYKWSRTMGIRTGAGVSTLVDSSVTPVWAVGINDGWRYLEHVATAFGLINEIGAAWESMVANSNPLLRPPNTPAGRAALVATANSTANRFRDQTWIRSGEVIEDPTFPPSGNVAYFTFRNLVVALRTERIVLSLPFGTP